MRQYVVYFCLAASNEHFIMIICVPSVFTVYEEDGSLVLLPHANVESVIEAATILALLYLDPSLH